MKFVVPHKIVSITITIVFIFPFFIQSIHSWHHTCQVPYHKKNVKNVSSKDIDCKVFHNSIHKTLHLTDVAYKIINTPCYLKEQIVDYTSVNNTCNLTKSSRAPPCNLV